MDDSGTNVGAKMVIQPNVNAAYRGDRSFYLAGPELDQQNGSGAAKVPQPNPDATADLTSKSLQAKVKYDAEFNNVTGVTWSPAFVLQRLACPALPPSTTNPFVTIDYWESDPIAVNNRLKYDKDGNTFNATTPGEPKDWSETFAWGRRQPYDGVVKYTQAQEASYKQAPQGGGMGKINYTFAQHNGQTTMGQANWPNVGDQTLQLPFTPLAHYDRAVINPTELFNVVAVKPHELTHEFYGPPGGANPGLTATTKRQKYTADWLDHSLVPNGARAVRHVPVPRPRAAPHAHAPRGPGHGRPGPGQDQHQHDFHQGSVRRRVRRPTGGRPGPEPVRPAGGGRRLDCPVAGPAGTRGYTDSDPSNRPAVRRRRHVLVSPPGAWDRLRTVARPDMLWPMTAGKNTEEYTKGAPRRPRRGRREVRDAQQGVQPVHHPEQLLRRLHDVRLLRGAEPRPVQQDNRPVLGKELGSDDGTVTRHKYFAVIDRTNLSVEAFAPNQQLVVAGQPIAPIPPGAGPGLLLVPASRSPATESGHAVQGGGGPIDSQTSPPAPVTVNVGTCRRSARPSIRPPATSIPGMVLGQYDGTPWTIRAGVSQFMLDVGQRQEAATLVGAAFDAPTNSAVLTLQLSGTIPHDRGAVLRLTNPDPNQLPSTPGNPGPQPGFNYKSPRYAPVVKYVEQLR